MFYSIIRNIEIYIESNNYILFGVHFYKMGWNGMGNFNIKKVLAFYLLEKLKEKNDKKYGLKSQNVYYDENVF